jgi:hypothetical protein
VRKIFKNMDSDEDDRLTFKEFVEGTKGDATILKVRLSAVILTFLGSDSVIVDYDPAPWFQVIHSGCCV